MVERPLLAVRGLSKVHGRGCPDCLRLTGPAFNTNACPTCRSIVACDEVDLDVYDGEVVGVVGESGSGKSTVLQCLFQDLRPTAGEAFLSTFANGAKSIWDANLREQRFLRSQLLAGAFPKKDYIGLVIGLRKKYWPLALTPEQWEKICT